MPIPGPVLRWLAGIGLASLCASPSLGQITQETITNTKRVEMARDFFAESTFTREEFMAALDSLDRPLADPVLSAVFATYADAVARAERTGLDALYVGDGTEVRFPARSGRELVAIAGTASDLTAKATEAAVAELAQSASTPTFGADAIAADLYRRLASRKYMSALSGYHRDGDPGYDTLVDYFLALRVDAGIAEAAARAAKDEAAKAALDAAIAEYRATGEALGRRVVEQCGRQLVAPRVYWGGPDPVPAEFERSIDIIRKDQIVWQKANDRLGAAIEMHLTAGVAADSADPHAPSRWRLRHFEGTASRATSVLSWASTVADAAACLGASEPELAAMKAILDQSLGERVERIKATLAAYQDWVAEAKAKGVHPYSTEPSQALMRAFERQSALDRATRDRLLGAAQSPLLAEQLRAMASPEEGARAPGWLRIARNRARAAQAPAEEQGDGQGGAK